jgi:hypothetical protein
VQEKESLNLKTDDFKTVDSVCLDNVSDSVSVPALKPVIFVKPGFVSECASTSNNVNDRQNQVPSGPSDNQVPKSNKTHVPSGRVFVKKFDYRDNQRSPSETSTSYGSAGYQNIFYCYNCGKAGHIARNCMHPSYSSSEPFWQHNSNGNYYSHTYSRSSSSDGDWNADKSRRSKDKDIRNRPSNGQKTNDQRIKQDKGLKAHDQKIKQDKGLKAHDQRAKHDKGLKAHDQSIHKAYGHKAHNQKAKKSNGQRPKGQKDKKAKTNVKSVPITPPTKKHVQNSKKNSVSKSCANSPILVSNKVLKPNYRWVPKSALPKTAQKAVSPSDSKVTKDNKRTDMNVNDKQPSSKKVWVTKSS